MAETESGNIGKGYLARKKSKLTQEALNAFLVAAQTLAERGEVIEAELRFTEALKTAEKEFGPNSDQVMLVLSILAAFYRNRNRKWEAQSIECRLAAWQMQNEKEDEEEDLGALSQKLSERKKRGEHEAAKMQKAAPSLKTIPPHIRKACQVLGLTPKVGLTIDDVNKAWKQQMLHTSAHPDLGGNTDEAVILNRAKTTLMEHMQAGTTGLSKKFKKASP